MTLWFYFLWTLAVFRVGSGPVFTFFRKLLWIIVISAGAWILIGAFTYQTQYTTYLLKQREFEAKKEKLSKEKEKLETIVLSHPTSRDVIMRLAILSAQFGERERLLEYVSRLREIDPNSDQVKDLLRSL